VPKRVAAGLGDVRCVAVVLLRRPHDLRLRRPGEPPRPRGRTAPGAGASAAAGTGARIAGGGACSHLSPRSVDSRVQSSLTGGERERGGARTPELGRTEPGQAGPLW
jgi:hypothetical protein